MSEQAEYDAPFDEKQAEAAIQRIRIAITSGDRAKAGRSVRRGLATSNVQAHTLPGDAGASPEPRAVFSTLRSYLGPRHSNAEAPADAFVALSALEALVDAVPWLLQWFAKQTHQGRFQGPGHAGHVVLGCLASTLPAVTDSLGSLRLREAAFAVFVACAREQRALPDIGPVLVDQLARRGLSHSDPHVRSGAASAWPILLSEGLSLDEAGKKAVLQALGAAAAAVAHATDRKRHGASAKGTESGVADAEAAMAAAVAIREILEAHPHAFAQAAESLSPPMHQRQGQVSQNSKESGAKSVPKAAGGNGYTAYLEPGHPVRLSKSPARHQSSSEPVAMGFIPLDLLEKLLYGEAAAARKNAGKSAGNSYSSGSGSGGDRIAAMEQLQILLGALPRGAVAEALPYVGELTAMLGLLADDESVAVALAALKAMCAFLWAVSDLVCDDGASVEQRSALLPHVEVICDVLLPKLADGKVAARHHAQASLSALIRSTGLAPLAPFLRGREGLGSANWHAREGAVAAYMAAMLWEHGDIKAAVHSNAGVNAAAAGGGRGKGKGAQRGGRKAASVNKADAEAIVAQIGPLASDPLAEVREAAVEALALSQALFGDDVDVLRLLQCNGSLSKAESSDQSSRRAGACQTERHAGSERARADGESALVSRLTGGLSCLPVLASDGTVTYGSRRRAPASNAAAAAAHDKGLSADRLRASVGGSPSSYQQQQLLQQQQQQQQRARRHSVDSAASPTYKDADHFEGDALGHQASGTRGAAAAAQRRPVSDQSSPGKGKLGQTWSFETERAQREQHRAEEQPLAATLGGGRRNLRRDEREPAIGARNYRPGYDGAGYVASGSSQRCGSNSPKHHWGANAADVLSDGAGGSEGSRHGLKLPPPVRNGGNSGLGSGSDYSCSPMAADARKQARQNINGRARDGTSLSTHSASGGGGPSSCDSHGVFFPEASGAPNVYDVDNHKSSPAARPSRSRLASEASDGYVPSWDADLGPTHGQFHQQMANSGGSGSGYTSTPPRAGAAAHAGPSVSPPQQQQQQQQRNVMIDPSLLSSIKKHSAQRRGARPQRQHQQRDATPPPHARFSDCDILQDDHDSLTTKTTTTGTGNGSERPAGPRAASAAAALASTMPVSRRELSDADRSTYGSANEGRNASRAHGYTSLQAEMSATLPAPLPSYGSAPSPQTPMPVGVYDARGARQHVQTSAEQPLPLRLHDDGESESAANCRRRSDPEDRPIKPLRERHTDETASLTDGGGSSGSGLNGTWPQNSASAHSAKQQAAPKVSGATARRRQQRAAEELARQTQNSETEAASCAFGDDGVAMAGAWVEPQAAQRSPVVQRAAAAAAAAAAELPAGASPSKASAPGVGETFEYLTSEDLRPSPNPQQELARTLAALGRGEWPEVFHGLNGARRLALHHGQLLLQGQQLHQLLRDVLKQTENLRSQVAKNAILAVSDLWKGLGRSLDAEIPLVAPVIVKRMADKVEFLSDAAFGALDVIVASTCEGRALAAFLGSAQHRSAVIRAKAAAAMHRCVLQAASVGGAAALGTQRDVDRLVSVLPLLLQDGNLETRQHAKALTLTLLHSHLVPEASLRGAIPDTVFARLERDAGSLRNAAAKGARKSSQRAANGATRALNGGRMAGNAPVSSDVAGSAAAAGSRSKAAEKEQHLPITAVRGSRAPLLRERAGSGVSNGSGSSPRSSNHGSNSLEGNGNGHGGGGSDGAPRAGRHGPSAAARAAAAAAAPELAVLPELWQKMQSGDWREREAALRESVDLLTKYPDAFAVSGRSAQLVDRLCDRLSDGNPRVCQLALEKAPTVIASVGANGLEPVLATLTTALVTNAASTNKQLAALGQEGLSSLVSRVDAKGLVQPLASLATHGNARIKLPALAVLADVAPDVYATKPLLVLKHIIPVAVGLAPESKADIRAANNGLLRSLGRTMGRRLLEHTKALDDSEQQRIAQLIGT